MATNWATPLDPSCVVIYDGLNNSSHTEIKFWDWKASAKLASFTSIRGAGIK